MANTGQKKHSEEAEAAVSVLRALAASNKESSTVGNLLRDYYEMEGNSLMYKKFGYSTPEEFLKASGEFLVFRNQNETVVKVKPNPESAHILKMIAAQRKTRTKKSGFTVPRQPQRRIGGSNWNSTPSAYNKIYSQMSYNQNRYQQNRYQQNRNPPQKQYNQQHSQQQPRYNQQQPRYNPNNPLKQFFENNSNRINFNNVSSTYPSNNIQPKPQLALKIETSTNNQQQTQRLVTRSETNNNNVAAKNLNKPVESPSKTTNDLINRSNVKPQQKKPDCVGRVSNQDSSLPSRTDLASPKHESKSFVQDFVGLQPVRSVNSRLQITTPTQVTANELVEKHAQKNINYTTSPIRNAPVNAIPTPPTTPPIVQLPSLPSLPGRKTLQDRLKINQQVDSTDLEKASRVVTPQSPPPKSNEIQSFLPDQLPTAEPISPKEPFSWVQPTATPLEMLSMYTKHYGLAPPIYKYFKLKNKRIQCRVTVNGSTYSTYPFDYSNEFEGQFAAAQNAIETIKREEELNSYSVCLDTDYEIALKIYKLLTNCPHGMFSKNIHEAFIKAYNALLPDHWESIVLSNTKMFSREEGQGSTIVFANTLEDDGGFIAPVTSEAKCMSTNLLELPWSEQYWNIYITNPVSTVEIWARLVGPQFSDQMDTLITDIELSMLGAQQPKPKTLAAGEYYLVSTADCWYRVRVEEVDRETCTCECFFIDIGEWEKVSFDEIFACDPKWLELPGQSICFSLDGLEDFGENPKAKSHLDNLLSGKVCIGEILTTKDDYEKDDDMRIRVILYDTSSEEDINLNSVILKNVCEDTPVPVLNRKGVSIVTITCVDDSGSVYCQLKDAAMVYIQKLINNLVQSNAMDNKHRGLYSVKTMSGQQLYLVHDEKDKKWYRASLENEESSTICRMLYVDMGVKKRVNVSNVYRLEMLSVALSRYPPQAIVMKMFDIPDVNDYLLSRLRALLKTGLTAMVKVAACSTIPLVKIYMHLEQHKILVCVNDSIRSEMELEINSEVISEPRIINSTATDSSNSSISSKLNGSFNSDYSMKSQEATDLSQHFSSLSIEQSKKGTISVPAQVVPKLAKFPLPNVGEQFDVLVTIASNPNYFIVQPYTQALQLNKMMVQLQEYCMNKAQVVPKDTVTQGEVYAGLNSDDGHWYRVLVVNILIGPTLIHVYFCDFGQIRILDSDSLRILPPHLRKLPQQAVKAKLHGVQPVHGDWSTEDAVRFQKLTVDKKFVSFIRSIQADEFNQNDDIVDLVLVDVSTEDDIYIHQILIDEKRAVLSAK